MTLALNPAQIEVNCRRLYSFQPTSLDRDERGTLHYRPSLFRRIFKQIDESANGLASELPATTQRFSTIKTAVISTMNGMCEQMKLRVPICTFIIPGFASNSHASYSELAGRITALFPGDLEIQSAALDVIKTYNSVRYDLKMPHSVKKREVQQIHDYLKFAMLHSVERRADLASKEAHIEFTIINIQKQILAHKILNTRTQSYRNLEWVTSGAWRNLT